MPGRFRLETAPASGPPYFELVGADGVSRFDTRDKLFRATDAVRGSLTLSSRVTPIDATNVYTLGSCAAAADFVLGYMRRVSGSFSGSFDPFPDDWFYMSGTYVGFPNPGFAGYGGSDAVGYTLLAGGGLITLEERLVIYEIRNEVGQFFDYGGYQLEYEVWAGTFL